MCMQAVFLIMEFCEDGSLYDVMNKRGPFDESVVKIIIERVASAVHYLHKQGLCC
jgi:serine/threonine protein kinase